MTFFCRSFSVRMVPFDRVSSFFNSGRKCETCVVTLATILRTTRIRRATWLYRQVISKVSVETNRMVSLGVLSKMVSHCFEF